MYTDVHFWALVSVPLLKRSYGEGKVGKKNRKVCLTYNNILLWGVIVKRVYRICALFTRHFSFWGYRGFFLFIGKKEKAPNFPQTCFKGFSQQCTSLYTVEGEFLLPQKLAAAWNHARPWAFWNGVAQKASRLNFLFRTKFWNQDGFLG